MSCKKKLSMLGSIMIKKREIFYRIFIFFITFTYLSIWIWQGIDLTDTGYNLTQQWLSLNGYPIRQLSELNLGSLFIGGLWNSLIDGNYLIWAYFGSVLIGSFSILIIFNILKNFFELKKY